MPGDLRLISGRKLLSPKGQSTRPTTARVREAIMNILAPRLQGCSWLDLFGGSGVMGCEALERGAQRIVAVENNLHVAEVCKRNLIRVRDSSAPNASVDVLRCDCLSWTTRRQKQPATPTRLVWLPDTGLDGGKGEGKKGGGENKYASVITFQG